MTYYQEIKEALRNGEDFNNEKEDWATSNFPATDGCRGSYLIFIGDKIFGYKNLSSYARRVKQLLNRGY
jgi:hypothetical protein